MQSGGAASSFPVSYDVFVKALLNHKAIVQQLLYERAKGNEQLCEHWLSNEHYTERTLYEYYKSFYTDPEIRQRYKFHLKAMPARAKANFLKVVSVNTKKPKYPVTFATFRKYINEAEIFNEVFKKELDPTMYKRLKHVQKERDYWMFCFYKSFYENRACCEPFNYNFDGAPAHIRSRIMKMPVSNDEGGLGKYIFQRPRVQEKRQQSKNETVQQQQQQQNGVATSTPHAAAKLLKQQKQQIIKRMSFSALWQQCNLNETGSDDSRTTANSVVTVIEVKSQKAPLATAVTTPTARTHDQAQSSHSLLQRVTDIVQHLNVQELHRLVQHLEGIMQQKQAANKTTEPNLFDDAEHSINTDVTPNSVQQTIVDSAHSPHRLQEPKSDYSDNETVESASAIDNGSQATAVMCSEIASQTQTATQSTAAMHSAFASSEQLPDSQPMLTHSQDQCALDQSEFSQAETQLTDSQKAYLEICSQIESHTSPLEAETAVVASQPTNEEQLADSQQDMNATAERPKTPVEPRSETIQIVDNELCATGQTITYLKNLHFTINDGNESNAYQCRYESPNELIELLDTQDAFAEVAETAASNAQQLDNNVVEEPQADIAVGPLAVGAHVTVPQSSTVPESETIEAVNVADSSKRVKPGTPNTPAKCRKRKATQHTAENTTEVSNYRKLRSSRH